MSDSPNTDLMTVKEAASVLRVSLAAAYELVSSGQLASYRLGKKSATIRVSQQDLLTYLESCRHAREASRPTTNRRKLKHLRV